MAPPVLSLTGDQKAAIFHAWLDLCAIKELLEVTDDFHNVSAGELAIACQGSIEELEQEFPFIIATETETERTAR